jgi:hypothetical protein
VIPRRVGGDPSNPRLEGPWILEAGQTVPRSESDVLGEILSGVRLADPARDQGRGDGRPVGLEQLGESALIT